MNISKFVKRGKSARDMALILNDMSFFEQDTYQDGTPYNLVIDIKDEDIKEQLKEIFKSIDWIEEFSSKHEGPYEDGKVGIYCILEEIWGETIKYSDGSWRFNCDEGFFVDED